MNASDVTRIRMLAGSKQRLADLASSRTVMVAVSRVVSRRRVSELEAGLRGVSPELAAILAAVEADLISSREN